MLPAFYLYPILSTTQSVPSYLPQNENGSLVNLVNTRIGLFQNYKNRYELLVESFANTTQSKIIILKWHQRLGMIIHKLTNHYAL